MRKNLTISSKKFCLNLNYNGNNSYLFVNGKKLLILKQKIFEITSYPLCLGNISKDFTIPYRLETGLFGYAYDFSVDYRAIANDKISEIHKYLMEKNNIKRCLDLLKKIFLQQ